jgi:hypothetical protein
MNHICDIGQFLPKHCIRFFIIKPVASTLRRHLVTPFNFPLHRRPQEDAISALSLPSSISAVKRRSLRHASLFFAARRGS